LKLRDFFNESFDDVGGPEHAGVFSKMVLAQGLGDWLCSVTNPQWHAGRPLGLGSLIGVAYSCGVWVRIRRRYGSVTNFVDQLWYAAIPIAAYLVLAAAAFVSLTRSSILLDWIAIAVSVLLSAGIRNAWAITLWIAVQFKGD
jgi:hypothetical protein